MGVSYNKLFKLLIDKNLKKTDLYEIANISSTTLAKLSKNEYVSMKVLVKICEALNCGVEDIFEIKPESEEQN